MIWEDAIEEAKEELGVTGWTNNWDEVMTSAKSIMSLENSKIATEQHQEYLNSQEWKDKREKILKKGSYLCVWCKKYIDNLINAGLDDSIFGDKNIFKIKILLDLIQIFEGDEKVYTPATEVHHLDYAFKQTPQEEEFCVSLCSCCHKLAHSTNRGDYLSLQKRMIENLINNYFIRLSSLPNFMNQRIQLHLDYIKKITIKPNKKSDDGKSS